jgi:hypothetical protein
VDAHTPIERTSFQPHAPICIGVVSASYRRVPMRCRLRVATLSNLRLG